MSRTPVINPGIRVLESFGALGALLAHQHAGLQADPGADIFYTPEWFENLYRFGLAAPPTSLGKNMPKLVLLVAKNQDSNAVVCLPVLDGRDLCGLSNYYSSLFGSMVWHAVTGDEAKDPVTPDLWQTIARQLRSSAHRWPILTLSPMDAASADFANLQIALKNQAYWVDSYACFGNWYLDVAGRDFSAYSKTLPSALRRSIERGQRRLSAAGVWSIQIQSDADEHLESAIASFVEVYSKSWKDPEPTPEFIPNLARMAARQGWLRLGMLKVDGHAVAAQLWLVKSGKANIFKLAYIEGYQRFSVGSVLTHAMMKHCIDQDRVHEVDYLTGDDSYKKDWMSHRRERRGIVAFHMGTARGLWGAAKHFLSRLRRSGDSR